ncbi:hypothetical protein [Paraburkholderia sp. A1RO-5L]|uniref:hypothetical protein n=1 Tax=Paraburkholderia sp. A1RO-5L TaxID=3028370 RepID=UPI003B778CF4
MSTATKLDHLDLTEGGDQTGARVFEGYVCIDQVLCQEREVTVMLSIAQMESLVSAFETWKNGGEFPRTVHHSY